MSEIESKDFFRERLAVHRALAAQSPKENEAFMWELADRSSRRRSSI